MSGSLNEELSKMIQRNTNYNLSHTQGSDLHYISGLGDMMQKINISSINFKGCENIFKEKYPIDNIEELIIYKIEHNVTGIKIPILEYALFLYKNNETIRLDLDLCEDLSIIYYIPIKLDNDINHHDPGSSFYNDECNKYKSETGTDLSLYDRKNNFNYNNMSLCEKGCKFLKYDTNNSRVECECKIKDDLNFWSNETNMNDLLAKIEAQKSITNLGITTCDVLSSKENIETNPGFYSLIFIIILFIIVFIIFCVKGYNSLGEKIDKVIYKRFDKEDKSNNKKNQIIKESKTNITKGHKSKRSRKNKKEMTNLSNASIKTSKSKNVSENGTRSIGGINQTNNKKNNQTSLFQPKSKNEEIPPVKPDTDYEFNWLSYKEALKYDKRESSEYYCSLIRSKQLFFFTFCTFNDYNSGVVKKLIFFLSFALHYPVNALFFTDTVMHKIYTDKGIYNFSYQLPQILCSAIISTVVLRLILQILVLTDKDVYEVKIQKNRNKAVQMKEKKLKCILIKFIIFFALSFLLLGFFWYYLTCFNAIYVNTKIYLIENTFISFAFSLLYPFLINLIPMSLRRWAIKSEEKDDDLLYQISQFIQII